MATGNECGDCGAHIADDQSCEQCGDDICIDCMDDHLDDYH